MRSFGLQLSSFHLALSYLNILQPLTFQLMHILFMPSLSSFFLWFLIILVSYSSIDIKIFFGKQPHCHCAKNRERKLTKTLFIATVVSSLLTVPLIIFRTYYEVPLRTPRTILLQKMFWLYSVLSIFFISCKLTGQSKY